MSSLIPLIFGEPLLSHRYDLAVVLVGLQGFLLHIYYLSNCLSHYEAGLLAIDLA